MNALHYNINAESSPALQRLYSGLKRRRGLHKLMGGRVQNCARDHLIRIAGQRHKQANKLGAQPSGFLGQAAEKVARPSAVKASEDAAALQLSHPGMRRAFEDVVIEPNKPGGALTIPMHARAYNRRAYRIKGLFVMQTAKGAFLVKNAFESRGRGQIKRGRLVFYYRLVKSVRQKQDRTLLPSDEEIKLAALRGADDYVALLQAKGGQP